MRRALAGLKGVKDVNVSFEKKEAAIEFADKGNVSLDDLVKALSSKGYKGSAA